MPWRSLLLVGWAVAAVTAATPDARGDNPVRPRKDFRPRKLRKAGGKFRGDLKKWVESLNLPKDQEKKLLADVRGWQKQQEALEKAHARRADELARQTRPLLQRQER